jgi:dihydroneopterin aldolase
MLRNLIFAWPGVIAESVPAAPVEANDLLFRQFGKPDFLLEEFRERFRLGDALVDRQRFVMPRPGALDFLCFARATRRRLFLLGSAPTPEFAPFFEGTHNCIRKILAEHKLLAAETAFIGGASADVVATGVKVIGFEAGEPRSHLLVRDLGELQSWLETVPPDDEIRIEELELVARVGVPDEERAEPQRLVLSANLQPRHTFDELDDDLARTVDYAAVCAELREFVRQRADRLIETLADAIAKHLLGRFDLERVEIELRKFVLPETRFVAVRLARSA